MIIRLALVPLSMISILVMTPTVLIPLGSILRAILKPSYVAISALAVTTHRMMVLESQTYLSAILRVICSMFSGWPGIGINVIPGKSTRVRSGHVCEYTFNTIGLSTMLVLEPHTLSVRLMIVSLTCLKSVNF